MPRFLRPLNSIFGRLALLSVGLLVMMQLTWLVIVDRERAVVEADHVSRLVRLVLDPAASAADGSSERLAAALGLRYVDAGPQSTPPGCPLPCAGTHGPFETALRADLPPQSRVVFDNTETLMWIRYGPSSRWLVIPAAVPRVSRLLSASALMLFLAIAIALLGAWQIQKPVLRLARAAREFRLGHRPPMVLANGPSEVKGLIGDFNEMARELSDAEQERAVMLAGVAHDLRAPITRIQVRANLVPSATVRDGFFHDTESLAQIVTQFLDFARDTEANTHAPWISVDAFCRAHYAEAEADVDGRDVLAREPLFDLDLQAGDDFRLPAVELDRILSNLVENAFTYGAPPLCIATSRSNGRDRLSVRDHGKGMPEAQFARALRPFVRLDPARGGDAHCGLGLTIVRRLTRRYGGDLSMHNADRGGLAVVLDFPSHTPA
ncbi:ATP-binding protein [Caballeronia sp. SEWSISQ10-4 2]|uniref:ATP-binding protein n=1 Tax=Caballeronia sp. SEWSISQ10-4 2 TaxID=2937438 RepID=UPI002650F907|nr:ATP-binding protein [Caballeronia sp. SEWSISQ10-4 2]MDN7180504.1 ATP-binding protein [Caballeronia sp. SEWSISQ10-4 2]